MIIQPQYKSDIDQNDGDGSEVTSRDNRAPFEEIESRYRANIQAALDQAEQISEADIVVGVPFYNEADTLPNVVRIAMEGLERFYPNSKCVVVAVGSSFGEAALEALGETSYPQHIERLAFLLNDELLNGKGWCIRAILEIAEKLGADVVLLEADLESQSFDGEINGISAEWINLLLEPIQKDKSDIVASRFDLHYFDATICSHFAYPLLTAIYNLPIRCLTGGQWGISHRLLRMYLGNPRYAWETAFSGYGVDVRLATDAITNKARICEANLGVKIHRRSGGKEDIILRQIAKALFQVILSDQEWWTKMEVESGPVLVRLPAYGIPKSRPIEKLEINPHFLAIKYQLGFNKYYSIYEKLFSKEMYAELNKQAHVDTTEIDISPQLWAEAVYSLITAYAFHKEFSRGDLLNSLVSLHDGFVASRVTKLKNLETRLETLPSYERDRLISIEAEKEIEELTYEFRRLRRNFAGKWEKEARSLEPPVPPITYREFIPGVPLIVPTEVLGWQGNLVTANGIYNNVFEQQKQQFEKFVFENLKVPREASSLEIILAIKDFLHSVEHSLLPDSDVSTVNGTKETVQSIFDQFPRNDSFALIPEMAKEILSKHPPVTLMTKLGHTNLVDLLRGYDPCSVLALARWTEEKEYTESLWKLMSEELRPEDFASTPIEFLVVRHEDFPSLVELRNSTALDKLTARIVVSNLHKGMGGEFPKLRYFTTIAKDIVESERFGQIWQRFAKERKDFGNKIVSSINGHWGSEPLSAHSLFEDGNQRIMVERIRQMSNQIAEEGDHDLAEKLRSVADSYHLALILADGTFVTCSAWSWASYSFKGGLASPPPLSIHVERDWTSREFLVEYFKAIGGTEEEIEEEIVNLIAQGRESDNIASILLGTETEAHKIVPIKQPAAVQEPPPAGELIRFDGNPILKPIKEHPWESKYVLNAGAIRLENKVYLAYRAFGDDEISRIGLATSEDGLHFAERLSVPIFEPNGKHDQKGCEDPRLTLIGDRVYMAYTVFDGSVAQIALSSIDVEDFINYRWKAWRHHGLIFPKFTDKDAALFPEKFDGRYAMLHRVDPHIWITFSSHLQGPWPRKEHKILAGSTSGMMWDGHKIGAGAQPIKTEYGWLLITHGVDYARIYRLGVMLLDKDDPSRIIYRSPNPILEPANEWEVGVDANSWTSNVVFTCGAVPMKETKKEVLDIDDELIVYYGAADSVLCAASATIGALIPEVLRGDLSDEYIVPAR